MYNTFFLRITRSILRPGWLRVFRQPDGTHRTKTIGLLILTLSIIVATTANVFAQSVSKSRSSKSSSPKTTMMVWGVNVHWTLEKGMFPAQWSAAPENMHATPMRPSERTRSLQALKTVIATYPQALLKKHLKHIYLVDELYDYGELVGGMENADDHAIYLCNDRETSDIFFISVFHHEFAHLLLDDEETTFNRAAWARINPPNFHYGKGGIDSIKKKRDADAPDESYWNDGFLCQYAMSDMDEDFASLVEYMISAPPTFWAKLEKYRRLRAKVDHVIAFYHALDPQFARNSFHAGVNSQRTQ